MMKFLKLISSLFLALVTFNYSFGQVPADNIANPNAVATYECAGIYWKTPQAGVCKIRFKEVAKGSWKESMELVYDSRDSEYRGSIIGLTPNTEYQVELL